MTFSLSAAARRISGAAIVTVVLVACSPSAQISPATTGLVTPRPTSASTPGQTDGANLAEPLVGTWFGPSKALKDLAPGAGTVLEVAPNSIRVAQSNKQESPLFESNVSVSGQTLIVRGAGATDGCDPSEVATYEYTLTPSGRSLTMKPISEPCEARAAVLSDLWRRAGCRLEQATCLGPLDAGVYGSEYVRPVLAGREWTPLYGGLTFTVPDGWANFADWPFSYGLSLASDFEGLSGDQTEPDVKLTVLTQVQAASQALPCGSQPDASIPSRAADLIAFLRRVRGLVVARILPVFDRFTGQGWSAVSLGLSVDAATAPGCDGEPIVQYLTAGGHEGYGIAAGETQRLVLIDVGADELVAVRLEAPDKASLDTFEAQARSVIESMQFR